MRDGIRARVIRQPARKSWMFEHKWGPRIADSTVVRVSRVDGGPLTVSYGGESVEFPPELVEPLAEMINTAAAWTDEQTDEQPDAEMGADA